MGNILTKTGKLLSALLVFVAFPLVANAATDIAMNSTPAGIDMGAQYNGLMLKVDGTIPAGSDLVLRFTGAPTELHLREKGKVLGLLWMNVGKVMVKNVPKVCIVDASRSLTDLGEAAAPYGLEGVMKNVEIEEGSASNPDINIEMELLQLKEDEGLYSENGHGITLGPDQGGTRTFSAELAIPPALSPGDYHLEAVAVRDGMVVANGNSSVTARLTGFPAWLSRLAYEKSLLYGIMATVIAIISGFAIGLVFQSKGAH